MKDQTKASDPTSETILKAAGVTVQEYESHTALVCYDFAAAMLAEKAKREAK